MAPRNCDPCGSYERRVKHVLCAGAGSSPAREGRMVQNIAVVAWPVLMVLAALVPVGLGLRAYRRALASPSGGETGHARVAEGRGSHVATTVYGGAHPGGVCAAVREPHAGGYGAGQPPAAAMAQRARQPEAYEPPPDQGTLRRRNRASSARATGSGGRYGYGAKTYRPPAAGIAHSHRVPATPPAGQRRGRRTSTTSTPR
jgi:hypothetical protein